MRMNGRCWILCARLFLTVALGLPMLTVNVSHAEQETKRVGLSTEASRTTFAATLRENQPAEQSLRDGYR
jgi:hypothetical protein